MMQTIAGAGRTLLAVVWMMSMALPAVAQRLDPIPRTLVMTAFPPEWSALVGAVGTPREYRINGLTILTGTLEGKSVVLIQSGVSMVNAAMTTQLALDRFTISRIVFSGIAGGVDPALAIGDVVVPARWAQYMEVSLARRTATGWVPPEAQAADALPNYGMAFPRDVRVGNASEPPRQHRWFVADASLLALAGKVARTAPLARCAPAAHPAHGPTRAPQAPTCLVHAPKIVTGGEGVSGSAFADNAAYREYLFGTFHASVLDMESAAVAQVAYANSTPFIAFRSLSDLAGGDAGANQMTVFMALAAANSASVVRRFVAALPD